MARAEKSKKQENNGYLADMACPKCGSDGPYIAEMELRVTTFLTDKGWDMDDVKAISSDEIAEGGLVWCQQCGYEGHKSAYLPNERNEDEG